MYVLIAVQVKYDYQKIIADTRYTSYHEWNLMHLRVPVLKS